MDEMNVNLAGSHRSGTADTANRFSAGDELNANQSTEILLYRRKIFIYSVLAGAVVLAVLGFFFWDNLVQVLEFLKRIQAKKDLFRDWINSFGVWSPLVFIATQVVQVVFSPIPGELTGFLGGYIYGVWVSTLYSTIGLSLGSYLAFAIGRRLGRPFVEKLVSRAILDKFDFLVSNKGAWFAFIFFSIPGFPKDYMCYLLGLSPLRTRSFLFVATVGRIPGTLVLSLQGANLYNERYGLFFGFLVGILIVGALTGYYKESIRKWLRGKAEKAASD